MNMITLLVLFLILKKFFFEKVRNFMLAREQKVKDSFTNAEKVNAEAERKLNEYNAKIESIEQERTDILKESKHKADDQAKKIIDEAQEKAHRIIMDAENEIEREKNAAIDDMKEQIALLSVYAAEKIIEKQIDAKEQQHIIDGIIEEVDKSKWTQ
jgi:F-type H+-transporting ATPase subunit b